MTRCPQRPRPVSFSHLLYGCSRATFVVMKVVFELTPGQAEKLRVEAERLGVTPDQLAQAAITDLLSTPDDAFRSASERVIRKNEELYRRLA